MDLYKERVVNDKVMFGKQEGNYYRVVSVPKHMTRNNMAPYFMRGKRLYRNYEYVKKDVPYLTPIKHYL